MDVHPLLNLNNDLEKKKLFAEALLRNPNNPFKAACEVFYENTVFALHASQMWVRDKFVIEHQRELLLEYGEEAFLPTKSKVCWDIYQVAEKSKDPHTKLTAYRLYCDVRGFVEKPGVNISNNVDNAPRIMVVQSSGSDEEWEQSLQNQQQALINAPSSQ